MNNLKFPVVETFFSIQGEGIYTGVPSVFVRMSGCNLRCVFGNSRCDTPYSSFITEKPICDNTKDAADKVSELFKANPTAKHLVITGGEPMLYAQAIKEFIDILYCNFNLNFVVTVETNGTLPAIQPWQSSQHQCTDCEIWIDLWSISPKLSTSVDYQNKYLTPEQSQQHNQKRINIDNLLSYIELVNTQIDSEDEYKYLNTTPQLQLKFVYTNEESVNEIKSLLDELERGAKLEQGTLNKYVLLMPEGTNNDQLNNVSRECVEVCIREGWRFCDRLHIRIWGDKRGV